MKDRAQNKDKGNDKALAWDKMSIGKKGKTSD